MADFELKKKKCTLCLLPFDSDSTKTNEVCPLCNQAFSFSPEEKERLWKKQLELFLNFNEESSVATVDALVLWSGGSDSTLTLYESIYTLGLRVVAVKFECFFERQGIQEASRTFSEKHQIPIITVKADIRTMFYRCYEDEKEVSDKTIVDFPWDSFHASGSRSLVWKGGEIIARILGVKRVICGNNLIDFNVYKEKETPHTMGERFIQKNLKWLNPIRILNVNNDHLLLNLPLSLGYTKQKKRERLKEIGYELPAYCYVTTESDTELGVLLPALSKKVYPFRTYLPYASAYGELRSGYITREQWLEELVRANSYNPEDIQRAVKRMRELLDPGQLIHDISISVNDVFKKKFGELDYKPLLKEILVQVFQNQSILLSAQMINIGKVQAAIPHAKKAVEIFPNDIVGYQLLGEALSRSGHFQEALNVCRQAILRFPNDPNLLFKQAFILFKMNQPDQSLAIVKQLDWSDERLRDADRQMWLKLRDNCHKALGQTDEANEWSIKKVIK